MTKITTIVKNADNSTLYDKLLDVDFIKHDTAYKHLTDEELWFIAPVYDDDASPVWDNPVEALKEIITRAITEKGEQGFSIGEMDYIVSLFIYRWIAGDARFFPCFTSDDFWAAKYTYKMYEDVFLTYLED